MSYMDEKEYELDAEIQRLLQLKRELKSAEKGLQAREIALATQEQVGTNSIRRMKDQLADTLPSYMVPANVGGLDSVQWPFYFSVNFDLGTNPTFSNATKQTRSFQVTQEAGLLIMSVSKISTDSDAGALAPLQIDFIDRQSSRRFMNNPIPIQTIGGFGLPTVLPTPMLLLPNAALQIEMTSMVNGSVVYAGDSKHQFTFFGYRVRIDNAENVLSTIFG